MPSDFQDQKIGDGFEVFDTSEALTINRARLKHLASLNLDLDSRKVIDVGSGVGHLAQFFAERNCDVLCIDGRKGNIKSLKFLYPNFKSRVVDMEREDLSNTVLSTSFLLWIALSHKKT